MTNDNISILLFSLFFVITQKFVFQKDFICGVAYLFLFIYTIFTMVAYVNFPHLSAAINCDFGTAVFFPYFQFICLSFIALFTLFILSPSSDRSVASFLLSEHQPRLDGAFYFCASYFAILVGLFLILPERVDYESQHLANIVDSPLVIAFGVLFKFSKGLLLVYYCLTRTFKLKFVHKIFINIEFAVFAGIALQLGSRTDVLALMLGIISYEVMVTKFNKGKLLLHKLGLVAIAFVALLIAIWFVRGSNKDYTRLEYTTVEKILTQDYFSPAHQLLAAFAYNYSAPDEVIKSNFFNSLMFFGYPYLQQFTTELYASGIATRSQGFAFYIFTEGFMMLGAYGWIYNSFIVYLGLRLWRFFTLSNVIHFNSFATCMVCSMMANMCRQQSSYFIKTAYTYIIPCYLLYAFFAGLGLARHSKPSNT